MHVLHGIELTIDAGECLGVVGEPGSGTSSIAEALLRLPPPTAGTVTLDDTDLATLSPHALRPRMQMVFQDPLSSLNPRRQVRDLVAEPLDAHPDPARDRAAAVDGQLAAAGLPPALTGSPADRASGSPLDVSAQAAVLNLLRRLTEERGLATLFIALSAFALARIAGQVSSCQTRTASASCSTARLSGRWKVSPQRLRYLPTPGSVKRTRYSLKISSPICPRVHSWPESPRSEGM